MKNILNLIIIGLLAYFSWTFLEKAGIVGPSVCEKTLAYSIGNIDPKFSISKQALVDSLQRSENIWEDSFGLNLFEYKEGAKFKVNLIYDERQAKTEAEKKERMTLDKLEAVYENSSSEHDTLYAEYQNKVVIFERDASAYSQDLESYNNKVSFWNQKGGTPRNAFNDLEIEKERLDAKFKIIESQRQELNGLIASLNQVTSVSNSLADQYNKNVETYQDRFGESSEFNQGEYYDGSISIFQFDDTDELSMVLAHEMGHALGLDHVENPKSVMYYLMGEQVLNPVSLTEEDIYALKMICE